MSSSDILSAFAQALSTQDRVLDLIFPPAVASQLQSVVLVQRAILDEGVCQGTEARVACLTSDPKLPTTLFIGMPFAVSVKTDQGTPRLFPLIVSDASITRSSTQDLHVFNLVGRDPLHFIGQKRRLRTWLDSTLQDVLSAVLADWVKNSPLGQSFDFKFLVARTGQYPQRACYIQHPDESDAQFIERLLRPNGFSWFWQAKDGDTGANGVPMLQLTIFDDALLLNANAMASMPYHRRDGVQDGPSIDTLASISCLTPSGGNLNTWDHEAGSLNSSSGIAGMDQGQAGNDLAHALISTRYAVDHLGDTSADLNRLTQIQANNQVFRSSCLRGRGGIPLMSPATFQAIENFPPFDGMSADDRTYTTIRVEHVIENNLPAALHDAAQALAGDAGLPDWALEGDGADGKSKNRYTNLFYCVPKKTPIVPSYVEERDAPRRRRLTGIVISDASGEVTCDALGRIKVRLLGGEAGADTTAWVRNPVHWGGKDYGYLGVLRAGTEVELEVLGPDRLVIAAVHYNQKTPPPVFDHIGGLPKNSAQSGIVSRELDGSRTQQLRFLDASGNISVQLGTDHAATQLNIGSISTPMNQGQTQARGEGFELRTDSMGVDRAAKGLLYTTEARANATGAVADMPQTIDRLTQGQQLQGSLADAAQQAQAQKAGDQDVVSQALTAQIADLKGQGGGSMGQFPQFQAPHVVIGSAAGVQSTAQGSTHVVSTEHTAISSGGHTSVSSGKSLLATVRQAIKFFASQKGMDFVAAMGDIDLTALKNNLNLLAKMQVTVTGDTVTINGSTSTKIVGGGSFIELTSGGITSGTNGGFTVHASGFSMTGPSSTGSPKLPQSMDLKKGQLALVHDYLDSDGKKVKGVQQGPFDVTDASGAKKSGALDALGLNAVMDVAVGMVTVAFTDKHDTWSDGSYLQDVQWPPKDDDSTATAAPPPSSDATASAISAQTSDAVQAAAGASASTSASAGALAGLGAGVASATSSLGGLTSAAGSAAKLAKEAVSVASAVKTGNVQALAGVAAPLAQPALQSLAGQAGLAPNTVSAAASALSKAETAKPDLSKLMS